MIFKKAENLSRCQGSKGGVFLDPCFSGVAEEQLMRPFLEAP